MALTAGVLAVSLLAACDVYAQSLPATKRDEEMRLVVRPHVGDTLWLQLEQTMDTRTVSVLESPNSVGKPSAPGSVRPPVTRQPDIGPVRDLPVIQNIVMRMFAHSLVESSSLQSTSLLATADSLHIRTGSAGRLGASRPVALADNSRKVRVRVTPDGAMTVAEPGALATRLDATLSGMPAMLPTHAVSVGDQWERDIPLPSLSLNGVYADGLVRAQFRFDSLSRGGKLAYVSMTGTLRRDGAARDFPPGTQVATSGTLRGFLVLDRVRGWITDAETIIQVQSDVTPSAGDKAPARSMDIRLSQRLRIR